ncbi:MAG: hypothetical protein M3370_06295 [Actinomycetota bacterium]|nr:hypothetical protein [Actinomycetota bacterium]
MVESGPTGQVIADPQEMAAIGGEPRPLGDILREVAEGAAEFIFVG